MVVELPTIKLEMLASVATRDEKNPLVDVALDAMRLVVEALVIVAFVVVELPMIALVMLASVATRDEKNPLVLVLLVEKRLVEVKDDADAVLRVVWPPTERAVEEARLSTVRPVEVRLDVEALFNTV